MKAMQSPSRTSALPNFQIIIFRPHFQLRRPFNVKRRRRYLRKTPTRRLVSKSCRSSVSSRAKTVAVFRALEQRIIRRRPPMKSAANCWCFWRGEIRFVEGKRIAEQGAEGRKGYDNEAEGLLRTVGGLSESMTIEAT